MTIGQTIKLYRKEKNLTQSELAELIGVSTQAISKWETDSGMPDISQLIPLARVLEISTDNLLGYTDLEFEKEVTELRQKFGGINFISDLNYAEELYILTSKFFNRHPDVSDIAVVALEMAMATIVAGVAVLGLWQRRWRCLWCRTSRRRARQGALHTPG